MGSNAFLGQKKGRATQRGPDSNEPLLGTELLFAFFSVTLAGTNPYPTW